MPTITTKDKITIESLDDKSILDSALQAGVILEYSCKTGQCGVCKTRLLEGEVAEIQEQLALTQEDKAAEEILTCCCKPISNISIESENLEALQGIDIKVLPARISSIVEKTANIIEVNLRLPPNAAFKFIEGQYVDVIGPNQIRRSYSIANNNNQKELKLFIKKVENGLLSDYWFNHAKENDLLRLEGPKGTFFIREGHRKFIFLATGTGIAPIKALLDQLEASESIDDKGIEVSLYWGNRYPDEFFWQPNYENIHIEYYPVLSRESADWLGEYGYIQNALIDKQDNVRDKCVYACGSISMIADAKDKLMKQGVNEHNFYADAFVSS